MCFAVGHLFELLQWTMYVGKNASGFLRKVDLCYFLESQLCICVVQITFGIFEWTVFQYGSTLSSSYPRTASSLSSGWPPHLHEHHHDYHREVLTNKDDYAPSHLFLDDLSPRNISITNVRLIFVWCHHLRKFVWWHHLRKRIFCVMASFEEICVVSSFAADLPSKTRLPSAWQGSTLVMTFQLLEYQIWWVGSGLVNLPPTVGQYAHFLDLAHLMFDV